MEIDDQVDIGCPICVDFREEGKPEHHGEKPWKAEAYVDETARNRIIYSNETGHKRLGIAFSTVRGMAL